MKPSKIILEKEEQFNALFESSFNYACLIILIFMGVVFIEVLKYFFKEKGYKI